MSDFIIYCPYCQSKLACPENTNFTWAKCPVCGKKIEICFHNNEEELSYYQNYPAQAPDSPDSSTDSAANHRPAEVEIPSICATLNFLAVISFSLCFILILILFSSIDEAKSSFVIAALGGIIITLIISGVIYIAFQVMITKLTKIAFYTRELVELNRKNK